MFARHGIGYRSVDLDSVEYQKEIAAEESARR